jgi:uncharacterized integral membrane protein (TIGR00697 family)
MMIELAAAILVGKEVIIEKNIIAVASIPILPLTFFCSDVITEVYGYKLSRQIIWAGICCELIFAIICAELSKLPSPSYWQYSFAYNEVLGKLPRIFLAGFIGRVCGLFSNIYIISKWKILLKGKSFWLRSLGSSAVGEAVFTILSVLIIFTGTLSFPKIFSIIILAYFYKLIFSPLAIIPATICANFLKKSESVDVYDSSTNFNPFKIALTD